MKIKEKNKSEMKINGFQITLHVFKLDAANYLHLFFDEKYI